LEAGAEALESFNKEKKEKKENAFEMAQALKVERQRQKVE